MRDAIISAWSSDSSWQGPAITVSGRSLPTVIGPIADLFHAPVLSNPSLVPRQELTCSRRIDTVIEIRR
jgi:hypothetical protein